MILGGLAVLTTLGRGFELWLDRVSNPWAYAKPSLTGSWQAEAWSGNTRIRLAITLSREELVWTSGDNPADSHRSLEGHAMLCDSTGRSQPYSIEGIVQDAHGHETDLTLVAPANETPGLWLTKIRMSWDGATTLRGRTYLGSVDANGTTHLTFSGPPGRRPEPFQFLFHPAESGTANFGCKPAL
jgi:hypothetical protein